MGAYMLLSSQSPSVAQYEHCGSASPQAAPPLSPLLPEPSLPPHTPQLSLQLSFIHVACPYWLEASSQKPASAHSEHFDWESSQVPSMLPLLGVGAGVGVGAGAGAGAGAAVGAAMGSAVGCRKPHPGG